MRGVEGWGRHLCGSSATAAQATFALTHPANPGEIALIIASAARSGRDGLRHDVGRAAARLVDCSIAQEREEDSGEPACKGHDGNPLAPSHRDPCGPVPQVRRARIVEAEHRDGGLDQQPPHPARARFGDPSAALHLPRAQLARDQPEVGLDLVRPAEAPPRAGPPLAPKIPIHWRGEKSALKFLSIESCCQTFFPMILAAPRGFRSMAGR